MGFEPIRMSSVTGRRPLLAVPRTILYYDQHTLEGTRTPNPLFRRQMLFQLSYEGVVVGLPDSSSAIVLRLGVYAQDSPTRITVNVPSRCPRPIEVGTIGGLVDASTKMYPYLMIQLPTKDSNLDSHIQSVASCR